MKTYNQDTPWLLGLLATISRRPGMYLGDERVETLQLYINAYSQAREDLGFRGLVESDERLWREFTDWLRARTHVSSGGTRPFVVCELIRMLDPKERNVQTFFAEMEAFLQFHGKSLRGPDVVAWPAIPWTID